MCFGKMHEFPLGMYLAATSLGELVEGGAVRADYSMHWALAVNGNRNRGWRAPCDWWVRDGRIVRMGRWTMQGPMNYLGGFGIDVEFEVKSETLCSDGKTLKELAPFGS